MNFNAPYTYSYIRGVCYNGYIKLPAFTQRKLTIMKLKVGSRAEQLLPEWLQLGKTQSNKILTYFPLYPYSHDVASKR